jgi:hypothetical protein
MRQQQPKSDPWFAWTLVAVAALLLSNGLWFYNWRERGQIHAQAVRVMSTRAEPEAQVVYEYRERAAVEAPAAAGRVLSEDEECRGGVVIRRRGNSIESTGERCHGP